MLTMTNDSDIASKFKVTIRIRPNSKHPLFGTALIFSRVCLVVTTSATDCLGRLGSGMTCAVSSGMLKSPQSVSVI